MAQELPNARLKAYPDSGHGFLFQYPEKFGKDVLRLLRSQLRGDEDIASAAAKLGAAPMAI